MEEEWDLTEKPQNNVIGWVFLGDSETKIVEDADEVILQMNSGKYFENIGMAFKNEPSKIIKQFMKDFPRSKTFIETSQIDNVEHIKKQISKLARTKTDIIKILMMMTQASLASPLISLRDMIKEKYHIVECKEKSPYVTILHQGDVFSQEIDITVTKTLRVLYLENNEEEMCFIKITLKIDIVSQQPRLKIRRLL